jgi:dienelactone hydrolase
MGGKRCETPVLKTRSMPARLIALITFLWAITGGDVHAAARQPYILHTSNGNVAMECVAHCADTARPTVLILSGSKGFGSPAYDELGRSFEKAGLRAYLLHFLSSSDLDAITHAGSSPARIRYYATRQSAWIAEVQAAVAHFNDHRHGNDTVGVLGISLGAEIAAAASADDTGISALVLVDGTFPEGYALPVHSLPPLHLIWGGADRTFPLPEGVDLQRRARQLGHTASLSVYKGCEHDFFVRTDVPQAQDAHQDAARFFASRFSTAGR